MAEQPPGGWTKHAPAGGISLNGKFFDGGTFIPNEDMENATEEEKKALEDRQKLIQQYGPDKVKKMLKAEKQPTAVSKPVGIQENVYIIDDGTLLGGSKYGDLIVKKGAILPEDLDIARALKSNRIDCVVKGEVVTYLSKSGEWREDLESSKSSVKEYSLLNNLTPPMREYLTSEPIYRMSLIKKGVWVVEHNGEEKILIRSKKREIKNAEKTKEGFLLSKEDYNNI
jgi:hypothetical protein